MFDTPAKRVRENIARAKASLHKGDIPRSLEALIDATKEVASPKIFGRAKFEVEVHLQEYLKEFNRHPDVKSYFAAKNIHVTPYVRYTRGKEKHVIQFAQMTLEGMQQKQRKADEESQEKKEQRMQEMLDKAQKCLDKGEFPKGKSMLRHVADEFGHKKGVLTDVGKRLLKVELFFEAGEILEQAIEQNSRDSHALVYAIKAYEGAREFPKMEKLYKLALKVFGKHPKTMLHMAEMYLEWRKYDEAYDFAKQAVDLEPSLTRAQEIVDSVGKRIFTSHDLTSTNF